MKNKENKWQPIIIGAIFLMGLSINVFYLCERSIYTGIPDVCSTIDCNGNYYMSVVSNSKVISDKKAFAKQMIQRKSKMKLTYKETGASIYV